MRASPQAKFDQVLQKQRTLSERQIQLIIERHSILREDVRLRKLFLWLARECHWRDKESGNILLPYQVLTEIMGSTKGNCNTLSLLQLFKEKVAPEFTWRDHYYQGKKCRQVLNSGIEELAYQLLELQEGDIRMYLEDLSIYSYEKLQDACKTLRETAQGFSYPYADQRKLATYLHNLPVELFLEPLQKNFSQAYDAAMDREDRKEVVSLLIHIRDMPLPFYFSSRKEQSLCPRIFSPSTPMLPKSIRQLLYPDWIDVDLKNCQLAIAGGVFKIEPLQEYLYAGTSLWDDLNNYLCVSQEKQKESKEVLKQGVYSIVYGMNQAVVERNITNGLANISVGKPKRFLDHPIMKITAKTLQKVKYRIEQDKKACGAYGEVEFEEGMDMDGFISCLIQTYELSLIASCYDSVMNALKRSTSMMCIITMNQHDGFSVLPYPGVNKEALLKRFNKAIRKKSEEFGIITSLVG